VSVADLELETGLVQVRRIAWELVTVDELIQQIVEKLTVELLRGETANRVDQFLTGVTIGDVEVSTHLASK